MQTPMERKLWHRLSACVHWVRSTSSPKKNGPDFSGPGLNSKLPADYFFFFGAAFFLAGAFFLVAFFID